MQDMVASHDRVADGDGARHIRRLRSASVVLVVGLLAAVGTQVVADSPIGFIGIPIAGLMGWILAFRLDGSGSRLAIAILSMAFGCAVLGAYGVAILTATDSIGTALVIGTFGVVFFGIPALVLLLVPATAWALITSWLDRRAAGSG
jgi:hypothetical protein